MISKYLHPCDENKLTASVFLHLLHLPTPRFWQIIRNACFDADLPSEVGEPEAHLRPKWDHDGTGNTSFVEPDLFLRFPAFDLIIEAKIGGGHQLENQWLRELRAYENEHGHLRKEVRFLAINGLFHHGDWIIKNPLPKCRNNVVVHACEWNTILREVRRARERLRASDCFEAASARVLDHLVELLENEGCASGQWFEDFKFARISWARGPKDYSNALTSFNDGN